MKKNILYLSYDGMTDPLGQSQVLPYIIGLSKFGYQFTILSFEKPSRFENQRHIIESICIENNIYWQPIQYTKHPPLLSTLKDIRAMRLMAKRLHKINNFKLVHCRSYIPVITGLFLKKKFGIPFIFDMRGFWADERVEGKIWNLNNPVYRKVYNYFKKKEREFLLNADFVISLTMNAKNEILSWPYMKDKDANIEVIPCCVDLALFNPENIQAKELQELRKELDINQNQKVISYIGSIGTWYMLDEMLSFGKCWLQENAQGIFLFVTPDDSAIIMDAVVKQGLNQKQIRIVTAKRKEMPTYIYLSDEAIFFIKPSFSKKASSPTKQAEIMAMGKAVYCNADVGDTDFVITKYQSGIIVNGFEKKEFEAAIHKMKYIESSPNQIREGAVDFYSLDKGVEAYKKIYDFILTD